RHAMRQPRPFPLLLLRRRFSWFDFIPFIPCTLYTPILLYVQANSPRQDLKHKSNILQGFRWRGNVYRHLLLSLLLVMGLYSVCRVGFYLYNTSFFPDMNLGGFLYLMVGVLKFDLSALLFTNTLFISLLIITLV